MCIFFFFMVEGSVTSVLIRSIDGVGRGAGRWAGSGQAWAAATVRALRATGHHNQRAWVRPARCTGARRKGCVEVKKVSARCLKFVVGAVIASSDMAVLRAAHRFLQCFVIQGAG